MRLARPPRLKPESTVPPPGSLPSSDSVEATHPPAPPSVAGAFAEGRGTDTSDPSVDVDAEEGNRDDDNRADDAESDDAASAAEAASAKKQEREERITTPAPPSAESSKGAFAAIADEPVVPREIPTPAAPIVEFGRFGILGRLATGGMADIFLAKDALEGASRHVAIKVIRGEFSEDSDFARMFLNEGRLAMRLSHPNLCPVFECGRTHGRFFMAMEYVQGQTLREVLVRSAKRKTQLPVPVLLKIFSFVAEALDFAHRAKDAEGRPLKIVHRDVSPHNIMVRYDGVVKLLDFGVAKAERSSHSTEAGALKGKFSYMSPEQALGEPIDHRADIFSLGVCLFESLTGRRLFHRKAQYDTLKAILEQEAPPLSTFRDDIPEALEAVVQKALAKSPDERFSRASELQHAIEQVLADTREVVGSNRIGEHMDSLFEKEIASGPELDTSDEVRSRFEGLTATEEGDALPADLGVVVPGAAPSRLGWYVAAVLGLVLIIGGGVAFFSSSPDAAPESAPTRVATPSPESPALATGQELPAELAPIPPPAGEPADEPSAQAEPPAAEQRTTAMGSDIVPTPSEAAEPEPQPEQVRSQSRGRRSRNRGARRGGSRIVRTPGF